MMNYEELAFLNQQLAGMLKSGLPLEGALRQLTADMARGDLRDELTALEQDLKQGKPLEEALAARELPPLYLGMIRVGARGNDLPGALTMMADYYSRLNSVWSRLKGLMVYPVIVLLMAFGVSTLIAFCGSAFLEASGMLDEESTVLGQGAYISDATLLSSWFPPVLMMALFVAVLMVAAVPRLRLFFRWRLPGFREACLSQLASSLALLLRSGVSLAEAIQLVRSLEPSQGMRRELSGWEERLSSGRARFADLIGIKGLVPPLFVWLVAQGGEDLAAGFGRAADLYHSRAVYRIEMILYCVLPVSVLMLGLMILGQTVPLVEAFVRFMREIV